MCVCARELSCLYILKNSNVSKCINDVNIMIFADECVLYKSHECCNTILKSLQEGLNDYVEWGRKNDITCIYHWSLVIVIYNM